MPTIDKPNQSQFMHSTQGPSDELHPPQTANPNQNENQSQRDRRASLDSDILAYIDQSLKSLIGQNVNNNQMNNNNLPNIQTTPFLPMVNFLSTHFFTCFSKFLLISH